MDNDADYPTSKTSAKYYCCIELIHLDRSIHSLGLKFKKQTMNYHQRTSQSLTSSNLIIRINEKGDKRKVGKADGEELF